jgi:hypothetical protein
MSEKPASPYCQRHHLMVFSGMIRVEGVQSAPEGQCPLCAAISAPIEALCAGLEMDARLLEGSFLGLLGQVLCQPRLKRMGEEALTEAVYAEAGRMVRDAIPGELDETTRGIVEDFKDDGRIDDTVDEVLDERG